MQNYSLTHVADHTLLQDLKAHLTRERASTAMVLAHLAEVDARKLYLPAAYPSMYAYCVGELRLSEQSAYRRIRAARAARQFPGIFPAVAQGRLHLTAIVVLAPHLTPENAGELLAAAGGKTKAEIEQLLANLSPRPDVPTRLEPVPPPAIPALPACELSPAIVERPAPARIEASVPPPRMTALAPQRFALQLTLTQGIHDKLRYAQELLGHQVPHGDVAGVLDRALDSLIEKLEKRKFAATSRPRRGGRRSSANPRHIPARVKRAVWERDGGRCTFIGDNGHRCESRTRLEFDHVEPVARGGQATVHGVQLRCCAHNQFTAEQAFGAAFMKHKREEARRPAG